MIALSPSYCGLSVSWMNWYAMEHNTNIMNQ
jgi:hypothetical protein